MLLIYGPCSSEALEKRRVKINGRIAARYDSVDRTKKDSTNALNAVVDPTKMAPRMAENKPQTRVALKGFLKR